MRSFDIPRLVSVYPDNAGMRWWVIAWFNNKERGEAAVEIDRETAIAFIHRRIPKDAMLEQYYPKQMEAYHKAIAQTRQQLVAPNI